MTQQNNLNILKQLIQIRQPLIHQQFKKSSKKIRPNKLYEKKNKMNTKKKKTNSNKKNKSFLNKISNLVNKIVS